LGQGPDEVD